MTWEEQSLLVQQDEVGAQGGGVWVSWVRDVGAQGI